MAGRRTDAPIPFRRGFWRVPVVANGAPLDCAAWPKPKNSKPRERLFRSRATLIKGTPAKFLGHVDAPDEERAREQAAKEFKVSEVLKNRVAVQRDEQ